MTRVRVYVGDELFDDVTFSYTVQDFRYTPEAVSPDALHVDANHVLHMGRPIMRVYVGKLDEVEVYLAK